MMICCKTLNFIQFLPKHSALCSAITSKFLATKYEVEKTILQKSIEPEKLKVLLDKTDLLQKVFKRIKTGVER